MTTTPQDADRPRRAAAAGVGAGGPAGTEGPVTDRRAERDRERRQRRKAREAEERRREEWDRARRRRLEELSEAWRRNHPSENGGEGPP